jgi:hypothetical protein
MFTLINRNILIITIATSALLGATQSVIAEGTQKMPQAMEQIEK